jgi:hypothetical protein
MMSFIVYAIGVVFATISLAAVLVAVVHYLVSML